MLPPRACVAAEQGLKEKYMKPATAATLAQGDIEVEAGRRAGWAVLSTSRVVYRRNEDSHPARRLDRTAFGRQG